MLAVSPQAWAAELQAFESRHYTIHSDLPAEDLRPLVEHVDAVFSEYKRRFSGSGVGRDSRRGKEDLYLFSTREAYVTFLAGIGIDGTNSGGMFFSRGEQTGLATWVLNKPRKDTTQTLQHEGFHQFAHRYIGNNLPIWVNEGLAVYFEQARLVKGRFKIGVAEPHRIAEIRAAIEEDTSFDIQDIIGITSQQWQANMGVPGKGSLQYTQSWSICHFLIHADKGRYQRAFNQYLSLLGSGRENDRAFEQAFGTGNYEALERKWREYALEQLEPDAYSVMIDHLEFLAFAVHSIHANGQDMPETLDGLKDKLQQAGYRATFGEHTVAASDESIYVYTDARGDDIAFDYQLDANTGLPILSASRARPAASIQWITVGDELTYDIRYR